MTNFDSIRSNGAHQPPASFTPPRPRRFRKWKWLIAGLILVLLAGLLLTYVYSKTSQIFTKKQNIFSRLGSFIISPDKHLIGEDEGVVNALIMGIGGEGHDGAHLTDTMIVASVNLVNQEAVLISIPRDFALNLPKYGYNKINAAYAYAFRDDPSTAGEAAIAAVESVTGLTIPYYAVIDFKGFVEAVNDVGGVDVIVDQTFTDTTFPNDYPYDTRGYLTPVTFTKGAAHMDGRQALIFARSRHSENNNEGSDFARSERQKKILAALKDRVMSLGITNLSTINNLLGDFAENFRTNFEPYEIKRLIDLGQTISSENIYSFSLEPTTNLICSELVDAATGQHIVSPQEPIASDQTGPIPMYVLHPCPGKTLEDLHEFVRLAPILAKLKTESAVVEIQNSVGQAGLANQLFGSLADLGITIKYTTFKGKVPYEQTLLYDNSHGSKLRTLDYLKSEYNLTVSDVNFPASSADFVIIVGKDRL